MKQEIKDKIRDTLPAAVMDSLFSEQTAEANIAIINGYLRENEEKVGLMKDMLGLVALREIKIEDLAPEVAYRLKLEPKEAVEVALIMLREIFYPIKDFLPGIDDAITILGGEVPATIAKPLGEQFLKREDEIEEMQAQEEAEEAEKMAEAVISDYVDVLMKDYPSVGEMLIGSQKSILVKGMGMEMKPMIKYWIKDYIEKTGNYQHTNMDRIQYVCHDKNTRSMNEEERRQLNLVLRSVDREIKLPYSTKIKKIDFSLVGDEE